MLNSINMAPKKIGLELWLLLVRNRKFSLIKGYPLLQDESMGNQWVFVSITLRIILVEQVRFSVILVVMIPLTSNILIAYRKGYQDEGTGRENCS